MSCQPCQNCGGPSYVPPTSPSPPPPCEATETCNELFSSQCITYETTDNLYGLSGTDRVKDVLDLLLGPHPDAVIDAILDSIEANPELKAKFQALMS